MFIFYYESSSPISAARDHQAVIFLPLANRVTSQLACIQFPQIEL